MKTTWLKIKLWIKVTVFSVIALYVIGFIIANRNARVDPSLDFLFKKYDNANVLLVLLLTGVLSIFGWWLFKTVFKTIRQMRDVKRRAHLERIEREHAEMIAKAAKLKMRPEVEATPTAAQAPTPKISE
jgi:hypothetical protein